MTDTQLARELEAISHEFEQIAQADQAAAAEIKRQSAEDDAAIEKLLESVQAAKASSQWHNVHVNAFDVLACTYREQSYSSFLAWLLDPEESHRVGRCFSPAVYEGDRGVACHGKRDHNN